MPGVVACVQSEQAVSVLPQHSRLVPGPGQTVPAQIQLLQPAQPSQALQGPQAVEAGVNILQVGLEGARENAGEMNMRSF